MLNKQSATGFSSSEFDRAALRSAGQKYIHNVAGSVTPEAIEEEADNYATGGQHLQETYTTQNSQQRQTIDPSHSHHTGAQLQAQASI